MSPQHEHSQDQVSSTARRGRWGTSVALLCAGVVAALSLTQLGSTSSAAPAEAEAQAMRTASSMPGMGATTAAASPVAAAEPTTAAAADPEAAIKVSIKDNAFSPATLDVKVGDTVTWTNEDTAPHTVTVASGPVKFASSNLQKGDTYTYTFTKAGTYSYYCAVHPDMKATATVTGSDSDTPPTPGTPGPTTPPTDPAPSGEACEGLRTMEDVLLQHVYSGHLETSPGQQVQDALAVDQYVKTHLVLGENVVKPLVGSLNGVLDATLQHVYSGHLEASPDQQVQDILALDQYVKTHTVLVENLMKPLIGSDLSTC